MKVILSRKGFDSSNGGMANPIMPDGTMISMPIPSDDNDTFNDLYYNEETYMKIIRDLKPKFSYEHCHVDPDIDSSRRRAVNIEQWKPAFGQINQSAKYLIDTVAVNKGDLFLFFGTFHQTMLHDGHYKYVKKTGNFYADNDLHVIFGYLEVGDILSNTSGISDYYWHPHASMERMKNSSNTLFVPSRNLSFDEKRPGYGVFPFDEKRVLTMEGKSKATWNYNTVYSPESILCNRKNSAKDEGVYYAGIWQELGLKEDDQTSKWARSIF